MKAVLKKMDPSEHCPGCGALLVRDGGVSMCANCGFYACEVDESTAVQTKKEAVLS